MPGYDFDEPGQGMFLDDASPPGSDGAGQSGEASERAEWTEAAPPPELMLDANPGVSHWTEAAPAPQQMLDANPGVSHWTEAAPAPQQMLDANPGVGNGDATDAMVSPVGDFWGKVGGAVAKPFSAIGDEVGDWWRGMKGEASRIERELLPAPPPPPAIAKKIDWNKTPAVPPTQLEEE